MTKPADYSDIFGKSIFLNVILVLGITSLSAEKVCDNRNHM